MAEDKGGADTRVRAEALLAFGTSIFAKLGVPQDEAAIMSDTLVAANLRGVDTHGVLRMPWYAEKLAAGMSKPTTELTVVREMGATALLDGHDGLGQVISCKAMEMAISKARAAGVSYVAVRNSNHFGTCAYYAQLAIPEDMIGIVTTNGSVWIAPTGGTEPLFGNNPWSIAVPAGKHFPVVLDMANSVVAMGKIRIAKKEGKSIPEGWALDRQGRPTTDPKVALEGLLVPIAGYKGYGITLMMDLLSGVLSNSAYGPRVLAMDDPSGVSHTAHAFIAVSIAAFDDVTDFKARMDDYIEEIKTSPKAEGTKEIYLPGEMEYLKEQDRRQNGIPLGPNVLKDLFTMSEKYGIPLDI